jgi:predicted nucleic acid-binding Zn ribbon protein
VAFLLYTVTMTTYEYKCSDNPKHTFVEVRTMVEEASRSTCAEEGCNAKINRVFGIPPIQFNGTGFSAKYG